MWATFWDALVEVGGRKIVAALLLLAMGVGLLYSRSVRFGTMANVNVLMMGPNNMGPYPFSVPLALGQAITLAGVIWISMMIFAGSPQFVAMLEKGWRELTFSKGTPRWQILLARFVSLTLLFTALCLTTCLPIAVKLWWVTGIAPTGLLGGAAIWAFSFASLLSVGALASMAGTGGVALPIMAPIAGFVLSQFLVDREREIYPYITTQLGRDAVDWLYYIFPKCAELQRASASYVQAATLPSSWPVWTTGLFTLFVLVTTLWILERKSF